MLTSHWVTPMAFAVPRRTETVISPTFGVFHAVMKVTIAVLQLCFVRLVKNTVFISRTEAKECTFEFVPGWGSVFLLYAKVPNGGLVFQ